MSISTALHCTALHCELTNFYHQVSAVDGRHSWRTQEKHPSIDFLLFLLASSLFSLVDGPSSDLVRPFDLLREGQHVKSQMQNKPVYILLSDQH
jgi:hypothetical protein